MVDMRGIKMEVEVHIFLCWLPWEKEAVAESIGGSQEIVERQWQGFSRT